MTPPTPPGNGEGPKTVLPPLGSGPISIDPPTSSSQPPPSSTPPASTGGPVGIPPPTASVEQLESVLEGTLNPYQKLSHFLGRLGTRLPNGEFDVNISSINARYRIQQSADPSSPILVTVLQDQVIAGSAAPQPREVIRITYLGDGNITSGDRGTPHPEPTGLERTHHNILETLLRMRNRQLQQGRALYTRLSAALQGLAGRPTPETQSAWYDNFVVEGKSAYTFRRGVEHFPNAQLNQIGIWAETISSTGAQRTQFVTLSESGEINFQPGQGLREPLSPAQIQVLENLAASLELAKRDPASYQTRLTQDLVRLGGPHGLTLPEVRRSVDVPRSAGVTRGPQGELAIELNNGRDLFKWSHPGMPHWIRRIVRRFSSTAYRDPVPRGRMKFWMNMEALRWFGNYAGYGLFGFLKNPEGRAVERGDSIRMTLFPDGGGRLDVYRKGNLHNVIVGGANGPLWRARREIKLMHGRVATPTPLEHIQAAMAQHSAGTTALPMGVPLKPAPRLYLDRLALPDVSVRDVDTAWRLIQQQLPPDIEFRIQSEMNLRATEVNRIRVDLSQYTPPTHIEIRHFDVPPQDPTSRMVELIVRAGQDHSTLAWQDGKVRSDMAGNFLNRELVQARRGRVPRSLVTLGLQLPFRAYGLWKYHGAPFAMADFWTRYAVFGLEHLVYTPGERRLIGTPTPELSWNYYWNHVFWPFAKFSTWSGLTTLAIDGVVNSSPGLYRTFQYWRNTPSSLLQAYRLSDVNFLNPDPRLRPLRGTWVRGFAYELSQRTIPLFVGLSMMNYFDHGRVGGADFWQSVRDVGMVSLSSAALVRGVMASERLSGWALRLRFFKPTGALPGAGPRFAMGGWGSLLITSIEMLALGVMGMYERRSQLDQAQRDLRSELGRAIDRRNELITRLEHGENIPPRHLFEADQNFQQASATYRNFLDMRELHSGGGQYESISLGNDFADAYNRQEGVDVLYADADPFSLLAQRQESEGRLQALRSRHERMERELDDLYRRYGVPREERDASSDDLRSFLAERMQESPLSPPHPTGEAEPRHSDTPIPSPVSVTSEEGEMILEQFRWKAAREPAFIHWSHTRQAEYILDQFPGFGWNQDQAMAFLLAVDQANAERAQRFEPPLTLPAEEQHRGPNTARLRALLEEERQIRQRESLGHLHAAGHASILAGNTADFDRQMEDYVQRTNERTARALERIMEEPIASGPMIAMAHPQPIPIQ